MACLFCNIIQGKSPGRKVHEDDLAYAFEDIHPQAPTHILVCPKKHIASLNDIQPDDTELLGHLFQVCKKIAQERGIAGPGYRVVANTNRGAGQSVCHIHLHLLGGRPLQWPPG
ncbi:MAG: histidine triad nucleotide-binding protein [Acidobacteria bacterium]|nr:histidine triad nucleotide-binding protein [Acidobacteriota bacterium]